MTRESPDLKSIRNRRIRNSDIVHEYTFVVSVAFSIIFWFLLGGGNWWWGILFASLGIAIDLSKRSELDIAAVTENREDRRRHKAAAFLFVGISLLGSLGSALLRAATVIKREEIANDTGAIDRMIAAQEKIFAANMEILQGLPENYTTERKRCRDSADAALLEVKKLSAEREVKLIAASSKESTSDMFDQLATFFKVKNPKNFMILLLMIAATCLEISYWMTATQYWKNESFFLVQSIHPATDKKAPAVPPVEATSLASQRAPEFRGAKSDSLF
jgi:hypothetical protein